MQHLSKWCLAESIRWTQKENYYVLVFLFRRHLKFLNLLSTSYLTIPEREAYVEIGAPFYVAADAEIDVVMSRMPVNRPDYFAPAFACE